MELLHNNDSQEDKTRETMSPELVGAGALAALVTVIAGVSAATSMDIRYVRHDRSVGPCVVSPFVKTRNVSHFFFFFLLSS